MTGRCKSLVAAMLAVLSAGVAAEPIDFELPRIDGRAFLQLSTYRYRPVIVNFWDTDCPPCVREMPVLDRFASAHPELLMVGVTVSPKSQARDFLDGHSVAYVQLLGPVEPRGLLRRFGDPAGAVPHTVVLRSNHSICATHSGEVDHQWLETTLQRCLVAQPPQATNEK